MKWKNTGISEMQAMAIVERCIDRMVETLPNAADGIVPIGECFLDSLMLNTKNQKWFIWYNDSNGSTGAIYEM